ncbi:uncharacterized protein LOC131253447 [Magnolia sinica]|uniref:uncharacterized protein LOC131253447 n=1 Tax=Magnolia sinica TaxID=86752 RepID=UPI00265B0562|nr:uncharacterized protein LOC131253447 [Magnolia sinica]
MKSLVLDFIVPQIVILVEILLKMFSDVYREHRHLQFPVHGNKGELKRRSQFFDSSKRCRILGGNFRYRSNLQSPISLSKTSLQFCPFQQIPTYEHIWANFHPIQQLGLEKPDVVPLIQYNILEEDLHIVRSSFEQARFNLVTVLSNVEAKKRFECLEAVSEAMDAHLIRYFKQGYELLHQMEPYVHQICFCL